MHIVRIKPQRVVDHPRIKQSHEARHQYNTAHRPPGRRHTPPAPPCVPVLLCWHRLQPWGASHYMRAQGYNVSDSNTTRILSTLQLQVQCNPTSTHIRHKLNTLSVSCVHNVCLFILEFSVICSGKYYFMRNNLSRLYWTN